MIVISSKLAYAAECTRRSGQSFTINAAVSLFLLTALATLALALPS